MAFINALHTKSALMCLTIGQPTIQREYEPHHNGKIDPVFCGSEIRDIASLDFIRSSWIKILVQQAICYLIIMSALCRYLVSTTLPNL